MASEYRCVAQIKLAGFCGPIFENEIGLYLCHVNHLNKIQRTCQEKFALGLKYFADRFASR
jgi:hypothetical protein